MLRPLHLVPLLLLVALALPHAHALRFYLIDRERRCFQFDAPYATRIIGERAIANGRGAAVLHLEVKSSTGKVVHDSSTSDSTPAKFAFTTPPHAAGREPIDEYDYDYEQYEMDSKYTACVTLSYDDHMHVDHGKRAVTFWIRPDRAFGTFKEPKATDGSVDAITGHLEAMQNSLRAMVNDLAALQQRETRLVLRTEATGGRLIWLAFLSLIVVTGTATLQFLHFKTYFKSKKLI